MAQSKNRLKQMITLIHSFLVMLWLVISTVTYGIVVMTTSVFTRKITHFMARIWSAQLLFVSGIKVKVQGIDNLKNTENYIFMANHASVFDIPVLYHSLSHQIGFMAKKELFSIVLFGPILKASGNIPVDRSNARKARLSISEGVTILKKQKSSLVLFPEGTRSRDGNIAPFKNASFALALEAGIKIVPILITGTFTILKKNSVMIKPGTVKCKIEKPIDPSSWENLNRKAISQFVYDKIVSMQTEKCNVSG